MRPEDLHAAQLYIDGELEKEPEAAFLARVKADPELSGYVEQLKAVQEIALNLEVFRAPDVRFSTLPVRRVGIPSLSMARFSISNFLAGAVAAAICILLGFGLAGRITKPPAPVEPVSVFRMVYYSPTAHSVSVLGDFNDWSGEIPLRSSQGGYWEAEVQVPPGEYRYVFVVDGRQHVPDPTADYVIDDDFGSKNSVVRIGL